MDSVTENPVSNNSHFSVQANTFSQLTSFHVNSNVVNEGLQSQHSFGMWINDIISNSPGSVDDPLLESSPHELSTSPPTGLVFIITEVSPAWAFSTETTKVYFLFVFIDPMITQLYFILSFYQDMVYY